MFAVVKKKKPKTLIKTAPKREKSKVRSVSVSKSKENVRVKTKPDLYNNEESRGKAKAFISLNEELDGNKHIFHSVCEPEQKRRRTPQQRKTKTNSSQSQLLKQDIKKRYVHSAMDNKRKSKDKLKCRATKLPNPPSRKPRLHIDVDDIAGMELANQDHLLSVTSSGDIIYSSQQDSRNSSRKDLSHYLSKPHFEVDPNALLRIHLKKDHKKRVTAAIKIQKIWRGYQTRKLLDKVLTDIIKDYKPKNQIEEDHSENNFYNFAPLRKSEKGSGLSFNTAKISQDMPNYLIDCSYIKPSEYFLNLEIVINPNQEAYQSSPKDKQIIEVYKKLIYAAYPYYNSDSDDGYPVDILLYRHQRAIYSYYDIHEYLQESQRRKYGTDEEEEEDEFDEEYHYIIMETNEYYIESRKNSTHTKKNKTIDSRKQSKDDPFDVRKFSKESINLESRKRSQEMSIKREEPQGSLEKEMQIPTYTPTIPTYININTENLSTKSDYKDEVLRIKRDEIERWNQMIELVQATMRKSGRDAETEKILQKIVYKSEYNKKALYGNIRMDRYNVETRMTTHYYEVPSKPKFLFENKKQEYFTAVVSPIEQPYIAQKSAFRKKNLELDIENIEGTFKNGTVENIAPAVKSRSDASGLSRQMYMNWNLYFQSSNKASARKAIKYIIYQNLVSLSNSNLNNIINIREEMLKERKEIEEQRLRKMLSDRRIEMGEFQNRMMSLMEYVESYKIDVERARRDIEKGLRVAAQVAVKTQRDARLLGKGVGLSRSADHLSKANLLPFDNFDRLIVDYLPNRRRQPKNFFCGDEIYSDSDASSINEEELKKYKDGKYGSSYLSDMNKNIMIEEFLKSHKTEHFKQKQENGQKEYKKAVEKGPLPYSAPLSPMPDSRSLRTYSNIIVYSLLQKLLVECSAYIFRRPCVYETVSSRLGLTVNHPKPISRQYIFEFVSLVESKLPEYTIILQRLNQQIAPPPLELLKCMRVDFYEYEEISQYYLGRYEFVIPQSSCTAAIRDLEAKIRQQYQSRQAIIRPQNSLAIMDDLEGDLKDYVYKKERIWQRRANYIMEKRAEVLNIEMHCVFDCWNEQIIHLKNQLPGFSGIGLNEPTLALKDHNKPVFAKEVKDYMEKSKQKLMDIITDDNPINYKISSMSFEEMCQNEPSWICYTDYSLGYVLEVDYVIGEELMAEVARFLHQRQLRKI